MALMPLMMGFIFFKLSSGLNLYMFTSNLVGMGQQCYLNQSEPMPAKGKFKKKIMMPEERSRGRQAALHAETARKAKRGWIASARSRN